MGCWNQTCGLSNLPIRLGDQIILFILEPRYYEELSGAGFCYSDSIFTPIFLPIYGRYNDYGGIQEVDPGVESILDLFIGEIAAGPQGVEVSEESPADRGTVPTSVEDLINNYIGRGRLKSPKRYAPAGGPKPLSLIMFHRHIYEDMVERTSRRVPYDQKRAFGDLTHEKILNILESQIREDADPIQLIDAMYQLRNELLGGSFLSRGLLQIWAFEKNDLNGLARRLADFQMIRTAMSLLRKAWIPQTGQGSQNQEYALHDALYCRVADHIDGVCAEAEEEGEEFDGEETLFWIP